MTEQPNSETDLREYARIAWRRKWSIGLIVVLTVGSAMFLSFRQTPVYTSTAKVFVTPIGAGANLASPNMDTERGLVDSTVVARRVIDDLGLEQSPDSLVGQLSVSVETGTEILDVAYGDPSPVRARQLAQGFAAAYLDYRQERARESVDGQVSALEQQIASIQTKLGQIRTELRDNPAPDRQDELAAQRDVLNSQLGALQSQLASLNSEVAGQTGGEIVEPAETPTSPSSPSHVRNGALALACGLLLGVGFAFLRERLDDRLRGERDVEELGVPILTMVPTVTEWKRREDPQLVTMDASTGPAAEAYRRLATNLQFLGVQQDIHVLCVTSTALGDGKSTTVANLGIVMAQAGRRVMLVSCDLRRPRLHRFFDADNDTGLSTMLAGQTGLAESTRWLGINNLRLLPSGPVPPNPAELLASDRFRDIMDELRGISDFVLLDTPPVLAVSDAITVATAADATILVVEAKSATRSSLQQAIRQLEKVGSRLSGAVLNNVDRSTGRQYGYGPYAEAYTENGSKRNGSNGAGAATGRRARKAKSG
jgi:non-specific protein-tyrosine kinase